MENNYKEYLESFAWKAIKQVKLSEQPECECCGEKASTVHHLSYERRGSEREDDIVSICERCHHECHFVNGYQIKNDEEILRKRFEEIREEFGGETEVFEYEKLSEYKYKYENQYGNIYINGIKSKILCSFDINSYRSYYYYICYNGQGLFYISEYSGDEKESNYEEFTDISKHLIFTQNSDDENFKYIITKLYKIEGIKIFNLKVFENKKYIGILGNIYYFGKTFKEIDINTFETIGENHSKDKNQVYYGHYFGDITKIPADSDSFEVLNNIYSKDKNYVFYSGNIIEGADSKTFVILNNDNYSSYLDYNNLEYYNQQVIHNYSKDKNYVFYNGKSIDLLDPKSFEIMLDGIYHKDKNYVFYRGNIIEGADSKTFIKLNDNYFKDKNYVYYNSEKVKHEGLFFTTYADPKTFKVTGLYSGEDIKYKYSGSEKLKY